MRGIGRSAEGSQLVEFAFALPFLLVILVGITELSFAFVLRGKLANAAREGAREAVAQPSPVAEDVGKAVEQYLKTSVDPSISKSACAGVLPTWTCAYTSAVGVAGTIKIERPVEISGTLCCARVTVSSPYPWHLFNNVLSLFQVLESGAPTPLPEITLSSQAVMGM